MQPKLERSDLCFLEYWAKNKTVLEAMRVTQQTAQVIFFNGMYAGATLLVNCVDTGISSLKNETDAIPKR